MRRSQLTESPKNPGRFRSSLEGPIHTQHCSSQSEAD
jgi:hypothetical protein